MIGLICLKEMMLIKPMSFAGVLLFPMIITFLKQILDFSQLNVCDGCHNIIKVYEF